MPSDPALIFSPEFVRPIIEGRKSVTRRPFHGGPCPHRVGAIQKVQSGQGQPAFGRIVITSIRMEQLGHLTKAEARREGFGGRDPVEKFLGYWRERYGKATKGTSVFRIAFYYVPAD